MSRPRPSLLSLPNELHFEIKSYLYPCDSFKLRQLHPHFRRLFQQSFYEDILNAIFFDAWRSSQEIAYNCTRVDDRERTHLERIFRLGDVDVFATLLDRGLSTLDHHKAWPSMINMAISYGCVGATQLLIARGHGGEFRWMSASRDSERWHWRDEKCIPAFLEALQLVIDAGHADVNGVSEGRRVLQWAMSQTNPNNQTVRLARLLLHNGADPRLIFLHRLEEVEAWNDVCMAHYRPCRGAKPLPVDFILPGMKVIRLRDVWSDE